MEKFLNKVFDEHFDVTLDDVPPVKTVDNSSSHSVSSSGVPTPQLTPREKDKVTGDTSGENPGSLQPKVSENTPANPTLTTKQIEEAWVQINQKSRELQDYAVQLRDRELRLVEKSESFERKYQKEMSQLQSEHEKFQFSVTERQAETDQISRYTTELISMGELLSKAESQNTTLIGNLHSRERESQKLEAEVTRLSNLLKQKEEQVQKIMQSLSEANTSAHASQKKVVELQSAVEGLQTESEETSELYQKQNGEIAQLQSALKDRTSASLELRRKHDDLASRLKEATSRLNELTAAQILNTKSPSAIVHMPPSTGGSGLVGSSSSSSGVGSTIGPRSSSKGMFGGVFPSLSQAKVSLLFLAISSLLLGLFFLWVYSSSSLSSVVDSKGLSSCQELSQQLEICQVALSNATTQLRQCSLTTAQLNPLV